MIKVQKHYDDLVVQLTTMIQENPELTLVKALEAKGWTADAAKLVLEENRPSSITKQVKELNQVINGQEQL